jgi:hypothetical protein
MRPDVQQRVVALLKLVPTLHSAAGSRAIPGYKDWVADLPSGLSQDQQNLYLFMRAATWADSIKHQWLQDSDTPPVNRRTEVHIGYSDRESHGYWHFIDNAFASDDSRLPATPSVNVVTQILAFRTAIASTEDDLLKSYDLVWLAHLVGDIHSPVHACVRYYAGQSDLGGNTVMIRLPLEMERLFEGGLTKSAPRELHAFWDDLPGQGPPASALPFAAKFAESIAPPAVFSVSDVDPAHWADESLVVAQKVVYTNPIGKSPKPPITSAYMITLSYYDSAIQAAKNRVALAGARLAKLLNENLR